MRTNIALISCTFEDKDDPIMKGRSAARAGSGLNTAVGLALDMKGFYAGLGFCGCIQ
jgi:hypothetical protein